MGALLSLPVESSAIVDAVGGRWISGRPAKYAKLINQFVENTLKKEGGK